MLFHVKQAPTPVTLVAAFAPLGACALLRAGRALK
jgi:hypothetical protein